MSVASEINRIKTNIADAYTEAEAKGATMPLTENSANLAQTVASIPTGSSPILITKQITANKTYYAEEDGVDGYSEVTAELLFNDSSAPYGTRGVAYMKNMIFPSSVTSINQTLYSFSNIETIKFENGCVSLESSAFARSPLLREVILPNTLATLSNRVFESCNLLTTINIPSSLTYIPSGNQPFAGCTSLEDVTIENGFNCNYLNLSASTKYSVETIVSWLNALADRTGDTTYTLTIGTTNLNKLTAEQKAIATNKNWTLA